MTDDSESELSSCVFICVLLLTNALGNGINTLWPSLLISLLSKVNSLCAETAFELADAVSILNSLAVSSVGGSLFVRQLEIALLPHAVRTF